MSFRGRANRLLVRAERQGWLRSGCPSCRDRRGGTVLLIRRQTEDGLVVRRGVEPAPCRLCGQAPEQVIEVVERIVTTREEAAAALAAQERLNACPSVRA